MPISQSCFGKFPVDQSSRWADGSATGTSPVYCKRCHRVCSVEALTVRALQRFWRCSGLEARRVLPTVTPLVRGLEAFAGWESPAEYSTSPPISIALLLQWNVALSLMGTMGASLRDRCHKWQPFTPASAQVMEVDTPISEVQATAGSSTLTKAPASAEASVSVGASAAVEAPVSARNVPSGTGTSGEGGWKEAAKKKKKKKKGGSKPQGAVS